jgi:hypothetical protein
MSRRSTPISVPLIPNTLPHSESILRLRFPLNRFSVRSCAGEHGGRAGLNEESSTSPNSQWVHVASIKF